MSATDDAGDQRRPPLIRRVMDRISFAPEQADEPPILTRMRRGHLPSLAPKVGKAADHVRTEMSRLARERAIDEGNGGVMDVAIEAWVEQWHNDIDNEHDARQSELQLLETEAAAELERRRTMLSVVRAEYEAVNAEIARLTVAGEWPEPARRRRFSGLFRRRRTPSSPSGADQAPPAFPSEQAPPSPPPASPPPPHSPPPRREPKATAMSEPTAEDR
ncbi:hypothetical protein AB0C07_26235 [Actinoplanes missouriensis]|uniref:hypothetical protein n=1 Tax=Actinoplanes missouriensis TaxID=1866 RepID=UPI0033E5FC2B